MHPVNRSAVSLEASTVNPRLVGRAGCARDCGLTAKWLLKASGSHRSRSVFPARGPLIFLSTSSMTRNLARMVFPLQTTGLENGALRTRACLFKTLLSPCATRSFDFVVFPSYNIFHAAGRPDARTSRAIFRIACRWKPRSLFIRAFGRHACLGILSYSRRF